LCLSVLVVTIPVVMATPVTQFTLPSGQTLALYHGDLTEEKVDAIVNAANEHLAHGGGVAPSSGAAGVKFRKRVMRG